MSSSIVSEFRVTGMTCGHCEASVREEVSEIPGVDQIEVSAESGRLVIRSSAAVDDDAVIAAVAETGYSAVRV